MKMQKIMKRIAVLGMVAALIASGPVSNVTAAPNDNSGKEDSVEMPKLIEVDQSYASGGITPTVFKDSYQSAQGGQYRSRAAFPTKYILSEVGKSTTVKNQNPWGSCWAFGALSSLESSQLTDNVNSAEEVDPDYSERQLAWFAYEPQTEDSIKISAANSNQAGEGASYTGTGRLDRGGNMPQAAALLSTWQGAALEADVPYRNEEGTMDTAGIWDVAAANRNLSAVHLQNADFLASPATFDKYDSNGLPSADATYSYDGDATAAIKAAIMENGAVAIAYFADQSTPDGAQNGDYFNYMNYCQYVDVLNASTVQNHGVSIVGWDDDYPSSNFKTGKQPEGNGAWLVKNSWGDTWGLDGYFWLSYYDRTIDQVTSFQGESTDNYDNIYQYDYLGLASAMQYTPNKSETGVANVFTAKGNEEIQAVSAVTLAPDSTVSVKIYKVPARATQPVPENAELIAEQSKTIAHSGYHTIELDTPAAVAAGEKFSVVQVIKGGDNKWYTPVEIGADSASQKAVCNPGESYMIQDGVPSDMADVKQAGMSFGNAMIKAFTKDVVPESEAPAVSAFKYQAYDNTDTALGNAEIINVAAESSGINNIPLPAATSYIKITEVTLSDSADPATQVAITVKGGAYTLGEPIARTDFMMMGDDSPIVFTTKSAPQGTNTKAWGFDFSPDSLVLYADSGRVVISDDNAYLPANAVLTADDVTAGGDFEAVKTALELYGASDQFCLYNLSLSPALKSGEAVNLEIKPKSGYDNDEKTKLYYAASESGSMVLTEVADLSSNTGVLRADVSKMGYYAVARVKEVPVVPTLEKITYSQSKTLADVPIPSVDGGSWSWDNEETVPQVNTASYAATFTPDSDSQYRTYHADIALEVEKATPDLSGITSSPAVYGTKLSDFQVSVAGLDNGQAVSGTMSWTTPDVYPECGSATEYEFEFVPDDTDNYNPASGTMILTVNKKAVTAAAKDAEKFYGDSNPEFSLIIPDGTLVGNDTAADLVVTLSCAADETTSAGNVAITGSSAAANYDVTVTSGTLFIKPRAIGIKAKDVTINYGDALPDIYEVKVTNLVPGTDQSAIGLTVDVEAQNIPDGNLAGTYTLKMKSASVTDTNYTVGSLFDGVLTIKERVMSKVKNESSIPDSIAGRFAVSGNFTGDELLLITDVADKSVQNAFQNMVKDGQMLGSIFDLTLKKADGKTGAEVKGALTITIPVDEKYNGKQITILHYVKAGSLTVENVKAEKDTIDVYSNLTVTDGKVQVRGYSMSPFAPVLPKDADTPGGTDTPSSGNDNSKPTVTSKEVNSAMTGDTAQISVLFIAAAAALLAIIGVFVFRVRRRRKS